MNRIYRRGIKNTKSQKSSRRGANQNSFLHNQETINGFNFIELNEGEINSEIFSDLSNVSECEILRIKKKAQSIEGYYSTKGEDTKINENCFNCLMNDFPANELLYFTKRKDLLDYLRYCFYFLKKIIFLDNQIYSENKYDLDKCDTNYLNGWKFFIPKTMCKGCFLQMINMEHLFGNLKTIFSDIDASILRKNFRRNRSHFNPRIRLAHSLRKNEEGGEEGDKKRGIGKSQRRRKFKFIKNNKNISFDDKNGLILLKKNILSEELVENLKDKKEGKEKNKFLGKKKHAENNISKEQLVTEIKIRTSEFVNENNLFSKEKNNENNLNNLNKNNKVIKKDVQEKAQENNNISNSIDLIKKNKISINMKNNPFINNINNTHNLPLFNQFNANKEKKITNIFQEIMTMKGMTNKIVMKLYFKIDVLIYWIKYSIYDVADFREKLNNTFNILNINPLVFGNLIATKLTVYINNYRLLYNQVFKEIKEFEEIFKKIKSDSIPTISKNLALLKEQTNLQEDEVKMLDEMNKNLDDYTNEINQLELKYDYQIKNYFNNFSLFLKLIEEIKEKLS